MDKFWEEASKLMLLTNFNHKSNNFYRNILEEDDLSRVLSRLQFIALYNISKHGVYTGEIFNFKGYRINVNFYTNYSYLEVRIHDNNPKSHLYDDYNAMVFDPANVKSEYHRSDVTYSERVKGFSVEGSGKIFNKFIKYLSTGNALTDIVHEYIEEIYNG